MSTNNRKLIWYCLVSITNIVSLIIMSIALYKLFCRIDLLVFRDLSNSIKYESFNSNPEFKVLSSFRIKEVQFLFFSINFYTFLFFETPSSYFFIDVETSNYLIFTVPSIEHVLDACLITSSSWSQIYSSIIEINFFTKVSSFNHIDFECLQDSVYLTSNETVLVFFRVSNSNSFDLSCIIIFLISPIEFFPMLTKLQCFCFDSLVIRSSDSVDLPVIFTIDFENSILLNKKSDILFFYLLLEK